MRHECTLIVHLGRPFLARFLRTAFGRVSQQGSGAKRRWAQKWPGAEQRGSRRRRVFGSPVSTRRGSDQSTWQCTGCVPSGSSANSTKNTTCTSLVRRRSARTAAVYDRYPELFTQAAFTELNTLYEATPPSRSVGRLPYLIAFLVDGYMGEQTKHLGDAIANAESKATIHRRRRGYRLSLLSSIVQSNEADRDRRTAHPAGSPRQSPKNSSTRSYTKLWRGAHEFATRSWLRRAIRTSTQRSGVSTTRLAAGTDRLVSARHREHLRTFARSAPLSRSKLDLKLFQVTPRRPALAPGDFRGRPSATHVHAACSATWASTSERQKNVHVDADSRELKSPRAFCARRSVYPTRSTWWSCPWVGKTITRPCCTKAVMPSISRTHSANLPFEYQLPGR